MTLAYLIAIMSGMMRDGHHPHCEFTEYILAWYSCVEHHAKIYSVMAIYIYILRLSEMVFYAPLKSLGNCLKTRSIATTHNSC